MWRILLAICALAAQPALAQDKSFALQAPDTLTQTGFLKFLLPRFSLKTGIRITTGPDVGDAAFGATGTPVFRDDETVWHFEQTETPHTQAFLDWLLSDVGKRTIDGFKIDGAAPFSSDVKTVAKVEETVITGDLALGARVSLVQCGRCHVVSEKNRMNAIGSSPSFRLMRSFPDWERRFRTFFLLKPHPAFTQVEDVTEPFADHLPSPIAPIEVSLDDIEAILAYVATLKPAELGAPIQFQ